MHSVSLKFLVGILSFSDYYPFGMQMPGRHGSTNSYRYGFQGQETDDEVTGSESHVAYTNRCYDARLGRFLSLDPFARKYPEQSPYNMAGNTPIQAIDSKGNEIVYVVTYTEGSSKPLITITVTGSVVMYTNDWWNDPEEFTEELNNSSLSSENVSFGSAGIVVDGKTIHNADVVINFDFKYQEDGMSAVAENDHLYVLTDMEGQSRPGPEGEITATARGLTNARGGMVAFMSADLAPYDEGNRAAIHEFWRHMFLAMLDPLPGDAAFSKSRLSSSAGEGMDITSGEMAAGIRKLLAGRLNQYGSKYAKQLNSGKTAEYPQGYTGTVYTNNKDPSYGAVQTGSGAGEWVQGKVIKQKIDKQVNE
jgi:RHS repeat-associated protein